MPTVRRRLYFPAMYVTDLRTGIINRLIASVPVVTQLIVLKNCARILGGFSRLPKTAVEGSDTWSNDVIDQGFWIPLRAGRRL